VGGAAVAELEGVTVRSIVLCGANKLVKLPNLLKGKRC